MSWQEKEEIRTLALLCSTQAYPHQLQLIDLVGKRLDEGVEDGQSLGGAFRLSVVFHQQIRQFVPQFALPVVLEAEKIVLQRIGSFIALLVQEVKHLLRRCIIHGGGGGSG